MRSYIYILSFSFLMVFSCADDPTRVKTKDVIESERFVKILADIHLIDAITNSRDYLRKYEPGDSIDLYSAIFEKYGVSKAEFDTTVATYSKQPEDYLKIYDKVIYELNLRLDSLKENEPKFENPQEE